MKLRKLTFLAVFNLMLWSATAQAGITVYTPFLNKNDVCEKIAGHWTGKGKVIAAHIITCVYKGTGDITRSGANNFNLNITLIKDPKASSLLCPASETLQLPGECKNGAINIKTEDADLYGQLKDDGKTSDMLGTIMVSVGSLNIKTNVEYMHMEKQ